VIDTVRRAADVWTANDKWELLTNALMDRNHAQDIKSRHHAGLSGLLLELAKRGRLSEDDEEEVRASIRKHPKVSVTGLFSSLRTLTSRSLSNRPLLGST